MKKVFFVMIAQTLILIFSFFGTGTEAKTLVIGDSHSAGLFGQKFLAKVKLSADPDTSLYASCGMTLSSFIQGVDSTRCGYFFSNASGEQRGNSIRTPLLTSLIDSEKPQTIVIEMGTNYLVATIDLLKNDIAWLNNAVETRELKCVWIGPPASGRFSPEQLSAVNDVLASSLSKRCRFVDSLELTDYPENYRSLGADGIHYNFNGAAPIVERWASGAAAALSP